MLRLEGRTYKYISNIAGISRQRVQQLLSPPPQIRNFIVEKYKGYCADCGLYVGRSGHVHHDNSDNEDYNDIEKLELLCISCHRKAHKIPSKLTCQYCGKPIKTGKFCPGGICHRAAHLTYLTCSNCEKQFKILSSQAKDRIKRNSNGLFFCSKECLYNYRSSSVVSSFHSIIFTKVVRGHRWF